MTDFLATVRFVLVGSRVCLLVAWLCLVVCWFSIVRQHGQPPSSPGDRNGGRAHASYSQDDGAAKIKRQPVPRAWDRPSCPGTDALLCWHVVSKPRSIG